MVKQVVIYKLAGRPMKRWTEYQLTRLQAYFVKKKIEHVQNKGCCPIVQAQLNPTVQVSKTASLLCSHGCHETEFCTLTHNTRYFPSQTIVH